MKSSGLGHGKSERGGGGRGCIVATFLHGVTVLRYHVKHGMCLIMGGHISASLGVTHHNTLLDLIRRGQPLGRVDCVLLLSFWERCNHCEFREKLGLSPIRSVPSMAMETTREQ